MFDLRNGPAIGQSRMHPDSETDIEAFWLNQTWHNEGLKKKKRDRNGYGRRQEAVQFLRVLFVGIDGQGIYRCKYYCTRYSS